MDGTLPSAHSGGFILATIILEDEQGVVRLRDQTRAVGTELGLDLPEVEGLASAADELARAALEQSGQGEAELAVREGPLLQVLVRLGGPPPVTGPLPALLTRLRPMVSRLSLTEADAHVEVRVAVPVPVARAARMAAAWRREEGVGRPPPIPVPADFSAESRAFEQLQAELEETNRGVVALYAELEQRAEQLREAEDRLRLLLDSVKDYAICMLSPDGDVASWNAGAERIFGYTADEIMGRHVSWFYPAGERDADLPAVHLRDAAHDERVESEGVRVRRGGSTFDAHMLLTAVRGRGRELRGFSLVVRDITERRRLEEDLRRRAEDLAAANRAKEDFLATLSHELRTPLNAMLGWTRLLRSGKLDQVGASRALETIERNARLQEQLIADILDVSRIVTGKLRVDLQPIALAPVIDAALDSVRPAAEAKGVALERIVSWDGAVLGDPDRLQQVVWNLLANAIKFTPTGGRITILLDRVGPTAAMTVTDTGEGITPELLPFIFDRFRQGDASATRPHGGLGLGLSIVRHIVELHGGSVGVASEGPDRGASFFVRLPIRAAPEAPEPPAGDPPFPEVQGPHHS